MTIENIIVSLITGLVSGILTSRAFMIYGELTNLFDTMINKNFVKRVQSNLMAIENPGIYRSMIPNVTKDDAKIIAYYYQKMAEDIKINSDEQPDIEDKELDADLSKIYDKYKCGIMNLKLAVLGNQDVEVVRKQVNEIADSNKELQALRKDILKKYFRKLTADKISRCIIYLILILLFFYAIQVILTYV